MNWRSASIVIGILAALCLVLVLSVVYPFSTYDPYSEESPAQQFSFEEADEYRVTSSIIADGRTEYDIDGVVTDNNERYKVADWGWTTVEQYQPSSDGEVYIRRAFDDETEVDNWLETHRDDDDVEILQTAQEGDENAGIVLTGSTHSESNDLESSTEFILGNLRFIPYEQTDQDGDSDTYGLQDVWVEQTSSRITDTSGSIEADPETQAVRSVDVSWEQTELHRLTYLNYLLTTASNEESTTMEITYEFETDDVNLETPDWASDVQNE
ncbi:hypothetical protein C483_14090 [Natrialba hulunbeirensis JCM 10989]|uniref:Uncharacterized protein n=1 Tax=Natrialba hulunbeirensis JCM 10989 TaxID=1227493 RepID=L9ZU51_9EURY|nr:hypothetical protein [Natrialba hulunbeirensis]ELY89087.1 hypothetical protein C483_14090 [Natrialba hulunbeirensis JCM 10989]